MSYTVLNGDALHLVFGTRDVPAPIQLAQEGHRRRVGGPDDLQFGPSYRGIWGWEEHGELEFLAHFRSEIASSFEDELTDCVKVTESIYRRYQKLLEDYQEVHPDVIDVGETYPFPTKEIGIGEIQEAEEEIADREREQLGSDASRSVS